MDSFTTFNQFDKRFSIFQKFGESRTACPLFSLITCYNFMLNSELSQKQHESNIFTSITNYTIKDVPKYMSFEELLEFSNGTLNKFDIGATTPELITSGILSYENIFKFGYNQNYCVIFLKNRNYIVVNVKQILKDIDKSEGSVDEIYAVRDCHENTQRNFDNFDNLRNFLNKTYQFEQITCVDGVLLPEFSNIEYLVIDTPFDLINIDIDLTDEVIKEDITYVEEKPDIKIELSHEKEIGLCIDEEMAYALQMANTNDEYVEFI